MAGGWGANIFIKSPSKMTPMRQAPQISDELTRWGSASSPLPSPTPAQSAGHTCLRTVMQTSQNVNFQLELTRVSSVHSKSKFAVGLNLFVGPSGNRRL